jgi:hypothetical protein
MGKSHRSEPIDPFEVARVGPTSGMNKRREVNDDVCARHDGRPIGRFINRIDMEIGLTHSARHGRR